MELSAEDRAALAWQMLEDPDDYVARVQANFPNAAAVIAHKVEACKARMGEASDKRPRAEREADEQAARQPSALESELAQARAYADTQALLAAAKALKLTEAEAHLAAEAAKLAAAKEK